MEEKLYHLEKSNYYHRLDNTNQLIIIPGEDNITVKVDSDTLIFNQDSFAVKYKTDTLPLFLNMCKLEDYPNMSSIPLWCEHIMLVYISSGSMYTSANGASTLLYENDICLISAGCLHHFYSNNHEACTFYIGIINEELFTSIKSVQDKYIAPFFHSYCPDIYTIRKGSTGHDTIISNLRMINEHLSRQNTCCELHILSCLYDILAVLYDLFIKDGSNSYKKQYNNENPIMQSIISYIQENYSHAITIEDICSFANISRAKCFRLFNKYADISPAEFIIEYKLYMAKNFLINSDMSIADIATACGFAHQSHFTRHFSAHYGITPLKFRKQFI